MPAKRKCEKRRKKLKAKSLCRQALWITCRKFSKDCENTHFKKLAGIKQNLPFGADAWASAVVDITAETQEEIQEKNGLTNPPHLTKLMSVI